MKLQLLVLLFTYYLLVLPFHSFAQQQQWPRNPQSGKVEFAGVLPWPAQTLDPTQQQKLVRHWYMATLTDEKLEKVATASNAELTYAGLPAFTYLDSTSYLHDKWKIHSIRLLYEVHLAATTKGLAYRLSNFECVDSIFDAVNSSPLEDVLISSPPKEMPKLAVFYKRLRSALASW